MGKAATPGSRPKGGGEIRELARQHTVAAVATLVEIYLNGLPPQITRYIRRGRAPA